MEYIVMLILSFLVLLFLLNRHNDTAFDDSQSSPNKPVADTLDDINQQYKTNFCDTYHIDSQIYFGFYQQKVYFHEINNESLFMDYHQIKSWKIVKSQNHKQYRKIWGTLTITTSNEALPLIEIPYRTLADAQADLDKLEAFMQRMNTGISHTPTHN